MPIDEYQQRLLAASGDNNHFAIIISFQGRGILSNILPKILKEKQTKMLLISAYGYNFKNFDPDYHLFINNHENPRSIFVVGDEKQSIYGFQDASPEMFGKMYNFYKE